MGAREAKSDRPAHVRVVVDIDPTADRPSGEIRLPDGEATAFSSWLELLDGVERALVHASRERPADGWTT